MDERIYNGSEREIGFGIEPINDFTLSECDFSVELYCSPFKPVVFQKSEAKKIDENNYSVILDTTLVGTGKLKCKLTIGIPDESFADGVRVEVVYFYTGIEILQPL